MNAEVDDARSAQAFSLGLRISDRLGNESLDGIVVPLPDFENPVAGKLF